MSFFVCVEGNADFHIGISGSHSCWFFFFSLIVCFKFWYLFSFLLMVNKWKICNVHEYMEMWIIHSFFKKTLDKEVYWIFILYRIKITWEWWVGSSFKSNWRSMEIFFGSRNSVWDFLNCKFSFFRSFSFSACLLVLSFCHAFHLFFFLLDFFLELKKQRIQMEHWCIISLSVYGYTAT